VAYEIRNIKGRAPVSLARFDNGGALIGPVEFTCDLVDERGRTLAVEMSGANTAKGLTLQSVTIHTTESDDRLTNSDLRIPIDRILRAGVRGAHLEVREHDGQRIYSPVPDDRELDLASIPIDRSRRKQYDNAHYKQIANDYRMALAEGKNPTREIMRKHFMSQRTAGRHIRRARDDDYLGRAIPGRAGELPSSD
jgi:hypothetical protein